MNLIMHNFKKYQRIENDLQSPECEGLLTQGKSIIIQPKLDGTNCQMYKSDGELVITSRNKILSEKDDNYNCYKILIKCSKYHQFFDKYPNLKLCGEFLVQHKVKYDKNAYNKFYVFDIIDLSKSIEEEVYINYEESFKLLKEFLIECVPYSTVNIGIPDHHYTFELISNLVDLMKKPPMWVITVYPYPIRMEHHIEHIKSIQFLLPESENIECEGIVVKNYDYKNKFGRSTWCKIINENFYNKSNKKINIEQKILNDIYIKEAADFINSISPGQLQHLFDKCYYNTLNELGIKIEHFSKEHYGKFVKKCILEFIEDFVICNHENIRRAARKQIAKLALEFIKSAHLPHNPWR